MISLAPSLRSIVDHDGAVILDIPNNAMTTLDATGAYVWQRLQQGLQVEAIVAELVRDTGADEATIARDIDDFLEQLKRKHLVAIPAESTTGREL
jgi:hypothetical protein